MANVSVSDYYPLDPEAPSFFRHTDINNYINMAFLMLMVYDHALTFDKEVEWIWTLQWRLPKVLFLINRYVISPLIVFVGVVDMIYPIPLPFCNVIVHLSPWVAAFSFSTSEAVLILRVCTLYCKRKGFVRLMIVFFSVDLIAVIVITSLLTRDLAAINYYEFLPGCWSIDPNDVYSYWIPFIISDGIIMLLTLFKVFLFRDGRSPIVSLLARDSIVYFVIIFSTMVLNEVTFRVNFHFSLMIASECIACLSVSRMMMNIRGLVMEESNNTAYPQILKAPSGSGSHAHHSIHLSTLQSAALPSPISAATTYNVA